MPDILYFLKRVKNKILGLTLESELISVQAAAKMLNLRTTTLYKWIANSNPYNLPYVKIGRLIKYKPKDIEDFIEKQTKQVN